MTYYIIYEDNVDHTQSIMECGAASAVESFIEVKISEQKYSPKDFKVVKGAELSVVVTPARVRVMLKNVLHSV